MLTDDERQEILDQVRAKGAILDAKLAREVRWAWIAMGVDVSLKVPAAVLAIWVLPALLAR